jgi:hypothetical protein
MLNHFFDALLSPHLGVIKTQRIKKYINNKYDLLITPIYYQTFGAMHLQKPHSGASLVEILIEKDIQAA